MAFRKCEKVRIFSSAKQKISDGHLAPKRSRRGQPTCGHILLVAEAGLDDDAHFFQHQLFGKFFITADKSTLPER
jgi:hypothetical protein